MFTICQTLTQKYLQLQQTSLRNLNLKHLHSFSMVCEAQKNIWLKLIQESKQNNAMLFSQLERNFDKLFSYKILNENLKDSDPKKVENFFSVEHIKKVDQDIQKKLLKQHPELIELLNNAAKKHFSVNQEESDNQKLFNVDELRLLSIYTDPDNGFFELFNLAARHNGTNLQDAFSNVRDIFANACDKLSRQEGYAVMGTFEKALSNTGEGSALKDKLEVSLKSQESLHFPSMSYAKEKMSFIDRPGYDYILRFVTDKDVPCVDVGKFCDYKLMKAYSEFISPEGWYQVVGKETVEVPDGEMGGIRKVDCYVLKYVPSGGC